MFVCTLSSEGYFWIEIQTAAPVSKSLFGKWEKWKEGVELIVEGFCDPWLFGTKEKRRNGLDEGFLILQRTQF